MRIAQLVSNMYAVDKSANGAIYSHTAWLADGLTRLGHEVTVFGAGDSVVEGALESVHPLALQHVEMTDRMRRHYIQSLIARCYEMADRFDVIHSHFSLLSSYHARMTSTPTLVSVHSPIHDDTRPFLSMYRDMRYVSFTSAQRKTMSELSWFANIYHGVDMQTFPYREETGDYLLYLGRVTQDKGVHHAIAAAKAAGIPLIIAGKSYPSEGYWHDQIERHIDGVSVRYIGQQGFVDKIRWIQNARAVLLPTLSEETFGYIMIEAMACGTPVIAFNRGSVPEVIKHGQTGYIVADEAGMTTAIGQLDRISRAACRQRAERFFSVDKMVRGYENVYKRIVAQSSRPR